MNIASILERTIPLTFVYTDENTGKTETIEAKVLESSMTPAFGQMLVEFENQKNFDGMAKELSVVITEWNLDLNGEPFPPTYENLRICPLLFLGNFVAAIMETWQGKSEKPKKSPSGTSRRVK